VGWVLVAIGAITTVPAAMKVFGGRAAAAAADEPLSSLAAQGV
jgi:hypothetical protein